MLFFMYQQCAMEGNILKRIQWGIKTKQSPFKIWSIFYSNGTKVGEPQHFKHTPRVIHLQHSGLVPLPYNQRAPNNAPAFAFLENVHKLCKDGRVTEAVCAIDFMEQQGVCVPINVFYRLIQACMTKRDVSTAREIRSCISRAGFERDSFLGCHLIHLFSACGSLSEANEIFNNLSELTEFTWIAIISAHIRCGKYHQAFNLYQKMQQSDVKAGEFVFITILKACYMLPDLDKGKLVHTHIVYDGCESSTYIGNTLIDMYCKCAALNEAWRVFDQMPERTVVTWSAMIAGNIQHGCSYDALNLFQQLHQNGIHPNHITFASILKACSTVANFVIGKVIHSYIIEAGEHLDEFICVSLVDMYTKCSSLRDAKEIFDKLPKQNVVAWTTMLGSYAQHGYGYEALKLYKDMRQNTSPNAHTFVNVIKACATSKALGQGKLIHSEVIEESFDNIEFIDNSLIDMYAKCGSLDDASRVFQQEQKPSLVRWNAMIEGFSECGRSDEAFKLFIRMHEYGLKPDKATYVIILKACSTICNLEQGKAIHGHIVRSNADFDDMIASTLIHMYSNCGSIEDARKVFDGSPKKDVVTWNALIACYAQYRRGQEAIQLYHKLCGSHLASDKITCISVLKACSSIAALEVGKTIHDRVRELGCELDLNVSNALIDMYARCGSMDDASKVFNNMPSRDLVSWSAMIAGHAQHNDYDMADEYFNGMQNEGLKPNYVSLVSLLSACSHKGLLHEACQQFNTMKDNHGIMPTVDHCNCIIDLLARAGRLKQALELLDSLPFKSNIAGWTSLLTHCRVHGEVELGRRCFDHIAAIDKTFASSYVLMYNIYADAGMWEEAEAIKEQRIQAQAWKKPGKAFIEVDNEIHNFSVGDKSHPRIMEIYKKLKRLGAEIKEDGCLPHAHAVVDRHMSDEEKEDYLCGHCEKLAIAFGLISTPPGTPIRVAKNLRVCVDCHSSTKAISKIEGREIIVIDTYRVHRFKNGSCSCKDYF